MPWGDEPIWVDENIVGYTTTATFGHTVGKAVCMGYVKHNDIKNKGFLKRHKFELQIGAKKYPVTASFKAAVGKSFRQN
jgi:glycine cleavage system aminomethyltransferase T